MDKKNQQISVADVEGPWHDSAFDSGLITRCKNAWQKPIDELTNEEMATFLRQEIAVSHILPAAEQRVLAGIDDGSEMGQLLMRRKHQSLPVGAFIHLAIAQ